MPFNLLYPSILRVPVLKSVVQDDNRDGLADRLELSIEMPLTTQESIHKVSVLLFFDVTFHSKAKVTFDSVAYFDHDSSLPIMSVEADGDLLLRQSAALSSKGGYSLNSIDSLPLHALIVSTSFSTVTRCFIQGTRSYPHLLRSPLLIFHSRGFCEKAAQETVIV